MILSKRVKYLQVALNGTLDDAYRVINSLPLSDRILIEAGTPLIKKYGMSSITHLKSWWQGRLSGEEQVFSSIINQLRNAEVNKSFSFSANSVSDAPPPSPSASIPTLSRSTDAYIVADLKTMDRAVTETTEVKMAGASAAVVLGIAPLETINAFIDSCQKLAMDSMIDMMNCDQPYKILRRLKNLPDVVILHRGVDEESYSRDKSLPYHNIVKVKGSFNIILSMAGGDTSREVQRAVFNGADIVVVWKDFYKSSVDTGRLAAEFLKEIK